MTLIRIGDSSKPPASYPAGVDGWGVYIGGNTPHVWTPQEIAGAKRHVRYLLPIFSRSAPGDAWIHVDGAAIITACDALGVPAGSLVAVDLEAAVDPAYVQQLDDILHTAGWQLVIYGQLSTVTRNPKPRGGYWVGDWDGVDADPSWTGKQYEDAGPYDLSEFAASAPLWDTRPPAAAAATIHTTEDEMSTTSVNGRAGLSWAAGTKHVVQVTYDPAHGDPKLRVVLALITGPLVLSLTPAKGSGNLEIPQQYIKGCRGVILELAADSPDVVFDACAV